MVEPGHQVPESAIMIPSRSMNRNVLLWSLEGPIITPTDNDVLGGRGRHTRHHSGNHYFTQLVDRFTTEYQFAPPARKTAIINEILERMNLQERRFLRLVQADQRRGGHLGMGP